MKLQLIHTENYLIAVDDSKIEGGNKSLLILEGFQDGEPIILSHWQGVEDGYLGKKITHHLPLNNAPVLEGVELLPPLEDEAEKFAESEYPTTIDSFNDKGWDESVSLRIACEIGYNKAKEVYGYTEEDMVEFHKWLLKEQWFYHPKHNEFNNPFGEIKSTKELLNLWKEQKPKLPTSFDTETKQYDYTRIP